MPTVRSMVLFAGLLVLAGCSGGKQVDEIQTVARTLAGDFPLDLEKISLSEELAPAMAAGVAAFQQDSAPFPEQEVRDRLVVAIQRPETRQAAGEELYDLWRGEPANFLWATTAIRYEYLLKKRAQRDEILATPALKDTLTATGTFAYGLLHYSYGSRGDYYHRAGQMPGLSPLNRLILLRKTAMVDSRQGHHLEAVRQLLAALPEVRQTGGPRLETRYWYSIALYLQRADRLDDAVHAVAMGLFLADQSGNILYQGLLRKKLAGLLYARQEYDAAAAQYDATVAFSRKENLPWVTLDALDNAAAMSSSLGHPAAALGYDRQTLAHSLAVRDSLNAPRNMMNISDDFLQMGVLDSCRVYQRRARIWVDQYPDPQNLASLPFKQAEYYCHVGQYDTADSLLTLARDKAPSAGLALDEANLLLTLINRGLEMSQPALAYGSLKRLEQLRPVIFDQHPDQNLMADLELASADLNMALGEFKTARQALVRARLAMDKSGVVEKAWHYHRSSGQLAALRGDLVTADDEFAEAYQLALESENPGRLAESRQLLGRVLLLEGKTGEARELFPTQDSDPSFGGSFRTRLTNLWLRGRSWLQEGELDQARSALEKAVALATPFSPSDVMAGVFLDLGRTLERQGFSRAAAKKYDLAKKALDSVAPGPGTLTSFLDDTRHQLSEAVVDWHLTRSGKPGSSDPVVAALLEANRSILHTAVGDGFQAASAAAILDPESSRGCTALFFLGQEHSYLWVGQSGRWTVRILPDRDQIQELAVPVLADLQQPARQPDAQALNKLGNLLLGPLVSLWQPGMELTLITDGFLNNIPWPALPWPGPDAQLTLAHGPISGSPGLIMPGRTPGMQKPSVRALLAMGYNGPAGQADHLRNAEREARLVAAGWTSGPADLLVGREANWSAARKKLSSGVAVLHLASHARVIEGLTSQSYLLLASGDDGNPLTPQTIEALSWPGELVFLSSCKAGLSHRSGQGMMGLAGAFLVSGVNAVLSSSGDVDDAAGLYLAQRFYHHWNGGQSKAAALQAAQLDLMGKKVEWAHPFYWSHYRLISN